MRIATFARWDCPSRGGAPNPDAQGLTSAFWRPELVFALCEAKQVEVVVINQGEDTSFKEELANDVLEIITVFSARLYGSRSHRNQKLLDGVLTAVRESRCL